jgi:hypothetical protein
MKIVFKLVMLVLCICLSIVFTFLEAESQTKSGEEINWQVLSNGGTKGISTNYILHTTIGQLAGNKGTSTNYIVYHGYWQNFIADIICDCVPGDCDGVPGIDILDIVHLIDWKFKGCPPGQPIGTCPPPCSCEDWVNQCGVPIYK